MIKTSIHKSIGVPLLLACCLNTVSKGVSTGDFTKDVEAFNKAIASKDDAQALSLGDSLFAELEGRYRNNRGFNTFKAKLAAADFLTKQMASQLKKATGKQASVMASEIFMEEDPLKAKQQKKQPEKTIPVAPALNFFRTSQPTFSKAISIEGLQEAEKAFLVRYYNLKLKSYTSAIARAGQALALTEPAFKGTHDYVLVLPLLHAAEGRPVNVDVLPDWMTRPEQLTICSDSCLLHFSLPYQAMTVAQKAAKLQPNPFNAVGFYKEAAGKCGAESAHTAVDCLKRAYGLLDDSNTDQRVSLLFDIVQLWLDSQNYTLAASQARELAEAYPDHALFGKAVWLRFYALSRAGNAREIVSTVNTALEDQRCAQYKTQLLYVKWWALRRTKDAEERVAVVEHELLEQCGNNPIVAPIMLSRATDLLARQDYPGARDILNELIRKFPQSQAATQAEKMAGKLQNIKTL